jgi:hypothetical protein
MIYKYVEIFLLNYENVFFTHLLKFQGHFISLIPYFLSKASEIGVLVGAKPLNLTALLEVVPLSKDDCLGLLKY